MAGAWFLPDESTAAATTLLERVLAGDLELAEPALWHYESVNLLRIGSWHLSVTWYPAQPAESASLLSLSLDAGLTAYDAAYLQLAARWRCPLLTADAAVLGATATGAQITRLSDWRG